MRQETQFEEWVTDLHVNSIYPGYDFRIDFNWNIANVFAFLDIKCPKERSNRSPYHLYR